MLKKIQKEIETLCINDYCHNDYQDDYLVEIADIIFNNTVLAKSIGVTLYSPTLRAINVKVSNYNNDLCDEYSESLFKKINTLLQDIDILKVYQAGQKGGRIVFELNLDSDFDQRSLIDFDKESDRYLILNEFNEENSILINKLIIPAINTINKIAKLVLTEHKALQSELNSLES
jgi:hypothetical protein